MCPEDEIPSAEIQKGYKPRLFHCIETLDKKATPQDTKFFHSNGPNYDPSNTSVLVDGPFCTDRFDTVPALSTYSFYNVYWY